MSSYNTIPYESLPIPYTYLPHLAGLGRLYGLNTADPEHCRVLDIGCAEGNNIIPMAWHLPNSEFVGIDLSEVQIKTGLKLIDSLSLTNIQLYYDDISKLKTSHYESRYKKFDYIILHGVFSWVSPELQKVILDTVQSLLNPNGLIYISYNTYPGWHAQMVLRDAMMLHCGGGKSPEQTIKKIPNTLHYFKRFFKAADNEFSHYNTKRLSALEQHSDSYLYHEFLETHNNPLYVTDFIQKANNSGLQYLSDALLAFDNTLILGHQRNALLNEINEANSVKNHRFKKLQYMDFMINQRFRRSLLCHDDEDIRNEFAPEHMVGLSYRGNLSHKNRKKSAQLNNEVPCKFYQDLQQDKKTYIKISHPVSKAAIQILADTYPSSIDYMDLLQQACQRVADHGGLSFVKKIEPFYQEFYLLLINDWVSSDLIPLTATPIDWNKPITISALSWQYAKQARFLPTFLQKAIDVDDFELQALELMTKGILKQDLLKAMTTLNTNKKHFWSLNKNKQTAKQLNLFLEVLQRNNLLEQV